MIVTLRLADELVNAVDEEAVRQNRSRTNLVETWIREKLSTLRTTFSEDLVSEGTISRMDTKKRRVAKITVESAESPTEPSVKPLKPLSEMTDSEIRRAVRNGEL